MVISKNYFDFGMITIVSSVLLVQADLPIQMELRYIISISTLFTTFGIQSNLP